MYWPGFSPLARDLRYVRSPIIVVLVETPTQLLGRVGA